MKPKNKGLQTLPDRRGRVKNCNPDRSFPCGKACLSISSDILGRCQKNLLKNTQNQALKLLESLKPLSTKTIKGTEIKSKSNQSNKAIKNKIVTNPSEILEATKQWDDYLNNNFPSSDDMFSLSNELKLIDRLNKEKVKIQDSDSQDFNVKTSIDFLSDEDRKNALLRIAEKHNYKVNEKEFIDNKGQSIIELSVGNVESSFIKLSDGKLQHPYQYSTKYNNIDDAKNSLLTDYASNQLYSNKITETFSKPESLNFIDNRIDLEIRNFKEKNKDSIDKLNKLGIDVNDRSAMQKVIDSQDILTSSISEIEEIINKNSKNKAKLLLDENGNPQSIMIFSKKANKDALYVEYLATAPWNVVNDGDSRKTKGSGTNLIVEAIKESEKSGKNGQLELTPSDSGIPFYEKLGFKPSKTSSFNYVLSKENAKILKDKFTLSN